MSDEKRNISDINDQKTIDRTEQAAFSEEIRRRLAEPGSGKPTLEEFKVMVYKDREKRRKKRNTLVACLVAAFIVGFLTFDDLVPEVGADKNPKETIQTEDGVIIEDGGYGSSDDKKDILNVDKWEHIAEVKVHYPQLLVPEYIPEGYMFRGLCIEKVPNITTSQFMFSTSENKHLEIEIIIADNGEERLMVSNVDRVLHSNGKKVYVQENDNKIATMQVDDGCIVNVWFDVSDKELIKVLESLDN